MRVNLPDPQYFVGKAIPGQPTYTISGLIGKGCNALVFRAHSTELNLEIACKVIPRANLVGIDKTPPTWMQEIQKANGLHDSAVVQYFHKDNWIDQANGIDCALMCCEFIQGVTLTEYIKTHRGSISVAFIEDFLLQILSFMNEMATRKVQHGDLHGGNILVEDRTQQLAGPPAAFRVTDFGVLPATSDSTLLDDYDEVAKILRDLLRQVNYRAASPRERYGFNILNDHILARHLTERDTTRDPMARNPRAIFERIRNIDSEFTTFQQSQATIQMSTPFDYLSCEQIGEAHSLLRALYSERFLALTDIENRNNLVLTGPRGCGKSTVFKSLSLRHRVLTDNDDPMLIKYVGIYYRCDDLYFAFPRYEHPTRKEAFDLPIHYLTATLLMEVLDCVEMWADRHVAVHVVLFAYCFITNTTIISVWQVQRTVQNEYIVWRRRIVSSVFA